jgi:long-chain acyl-CoA synthetase
VLERLAQLAGAAADGSRPGVAASAAASQADPADALDPVAALVAQIALVPPSTVTPSARLSSDLNLDSLQRVELLGVIEEELGTYIDDDALDPEATVADLSAMVAAAGSAKREGGIYGWPLSPVSRAVGMGLQALVVRPFVRLFYRVRTSGLERLDGLEGPVLFTPNHCLHLDNAIILARLPREWRWRLSIAAAADDIFGNPLRGFGASILANAFPLAREGAVRRSLELLGARLDRGFSILIFPEGKLTLGGPMQPFKAGVGLIAVEGATPIVPLKLHIHRMSRIDGPSRWWRGDVEFVIGEPLRFDADADPSAATTRLEQIMAAL